MEEVPLHNLPGPSSKTVSFRHPLSEFAHHPQKTDPAELPQTPSPTESEVSKPKQESPTRRRHRQRNARAPLLGSRCLLIGFCIFALLSTLAYLFYWHSQTDPLAQQDSPEPWAYWRWRKNDNGMPRILLWNRIMRPLSYDVSLPGIKQRWSSHTIHCLHENARSGEAMCEITDNRTRFEWSDAVVFEAGRLNMLDLPRRSTKFPMWVLWVVTHLSPESPMPLNIGGSDKYGIFPDGIRTRFNWTMGRRDDADIVVPYKVWRCDVPGDFVVANTAEDNRNALGHPTRTKEVAWIASGCETDAYRRMRARDRYLSYDKSEKWGHTLVDVDVFDKCGKGTCATTRDCVRKIAARYYFIVVRIQPDCFHSVYELIYDAFEYDLVPVVLAPPNTTLKVPYNSIVSSADIQKPGQLAAFLSALIDNPSEYERYFEWKKRCCLIPYREDICPLCQALHEKFPRKQAHIDAYDWWTAHNICRGYSPPLFGLDWAFLKADEPWL
uniref:Fucosyltransferase n=1 Tax=Rhipicephalus microplus TaxID=6941 RepID=A0A6M2CYS2_RHIMP